jgi:hypothetical protein
MNKPITHILEGIKIGYPYIPPEYVFEVKEYFVKFEGPFTIQKYFSLKKIVEEVCRGENIEIKPKIHSNNVKGIDASFSIEKVVRSKEDKTSTEFKGNMGVSSSFMEFKGNMRVGSFNTYHTISWNKLLEKATDVLDKYYTQCVK